MASSRISLRFVRRFASAAADGTTTVEATAPSLGKISVSKAKSTLRKEHDPDKALKIYANVSDHSASPVSSRYAQELTVRRLAKCRRFSDIETLIESHKNDPKIKEEPFYSTLIRSYGRASMFNHAMRTFEQMDQYGTPRSALSFNALLNACLHSKKFDKVPQLFDEIPQRYNKIVPDKISYGILIKSYCDSGSPEKGIEIMRQMQGKGMEVTTIAFTTILSSLYKNGELEVAESLWNEMVKKGCELDNAAYNVRIMSAQKESPERVKELIEEMSTMGLKPDTISYNYLMTAYCEKGMLDEAKKVYEGLEGNNCAPNAATFRTLIFHLCYSRLYEQGYAIFKKSVYMHKIPDFNTLKHLAVGLVEKKKIDDAKGLIRTVKKKFPPSFMNAWKKLEEELGLYSKTDACPSSAKEAAA
ncbi:Pentatricopeptide repeat [Arabidopsis suecica]|uniref:Pentatricopeptide repeat n=1 Tax=Arabidopsis suecica TaxID=45249 RepID=A0A8T1YF92_ARASU|nr:Pentatricopeptide repeat [Arabidopsis suecica]